MERGGPPGSAGVPPACTAVASSSVSLRCPNRHSHGGNGMGSANAEPMRHCRSIRVEVMGGAAGSFVRAGRPRSRVDFIA